MNIQYHEADGRCPAQRGVRYRFTGSAEQGAGINSWPVPGRGANGRRAGSFRLHDQVNDGRIADVQGLVPGNAITDETAAGGEVELPGAVDIGDADAATGDRVTEMRWMEVALMPDARRKRAAKNPVARILVQFFTDRPALPTGLQRIRQRGLRSAGSGNDQSQKYPAQKAIT